MANFKWYGNGVLALLKGQLDMDGDTFRVTLHTNSYTPNQDTHDFFDDAVASEITGTGYNAGGEVLAGVSVTYDAASNEGRVLWTDQVWSGASFTARYAIIRKDRGGADSADELVAYLDFGTDVTATAAPFTLDFTTSVLKITAAA